MRTLIIQLLAFSPLSVLHAAAPPNFIIVR